MTIAMKRRSALLAAALTFGFGVVGQSVSMAAAPQPVHKKNWIQRHPTLTGIGAGLATHHALKVAAARDKARHRKLNWAERHPTLSGMGVGVVTHHEIKKHTPK